MREDEWRAENIPDVGWVLKLRPFRDFETIISVEAGGEHDPGLFETVVGIIMIMMMTDITCIVRRKNWLMTGPGRDWGVVYPKL